MEYFDLFTSPPPVEQDNGGPFAKLFPQSSSEGSKPAEMVMPPASMSTPPDWAQSFVKALASPITEAGSYLGGLMGGQIPFHPADAMQEAVKLGSSMIGPKLGAGTLTAMAAPMAKAGARVLPEAEQAAAQGIRAYHGSPHDFEAFDLSKIGTGEGAQAYGHGLYFAENEATAQSYRDALKSSRSKIPDDVISLPPEMRQAVMTHARTDAEPQLAAKRAQNMSAPLRNMDQPKIADMIERVRDAERGRMYEVNINAHPDQFLDFDKPLFKQGELGAKAQQAMAPFGNEPTKLYRNPEVVQALHQAGIPGIKYLDQGSRGSGTGTSNYVVFDPSIIEIMKKYGITGLTAGPAASSLSSELGNILQNANERANGPI